MPNGWTSDITITLENVGDDNLYYRDCILLGFASKSDTSNKLVGGQVTFTGKADSNNVITLTTSDYSNAGVLSSIRYIRISCSYLGPDSGVYFD